ncbi:MAG TPA: glycosyltransferase [Mycobacteriales bacterium]|nr:glycosyltransferase [Mycobacteriales bacterium]
MPPTLALVVCSRDRPESLQACLAGITRQAADELLVIDSASTDDATQQVAAAHDVRCVRVAEPGLARARNAALRHTAADVVAFTDDDCEPQPGWAAAVRACAADSAGKLGFVLGPVRPDGDGGVSVMLDSRPRDFDATDDPSHIGHGANFTVSRSAWQALGGFDELLGVGATLRSGEDTDFLWRALQAGWTGRYEPRAIVVHRQWRSRAQALHTSYGYGIGAGAVRVKVRRLAGRAGARGFAAGSVAATLAQAGRDAGHGYLFGVLDGLARTAGIVAGRYQAARLGLIDGHLVAR